MQVPLRDEKAFQHFLDSLGYEFAEETANPAYRHFLS
jgi:threonine dehydratase